MYVYVSLYMVLEKQIMILQCTYLHILMQCVTLLLLKFPFVFEILYSVTCYLFRIRENFTCDRHRNDHSDSPSRKELLPRYESVVSRYLQSPVLQASTTAFALRSCSSWGSLQPMMEQDGDPRA